MIPLEAPDGCNVKRNEGIRYYNGLQVAKLWLFSWFDNLTGKILLTREVLLLLTRFN